MSNYRENEIEEWYTLYHQTIFKFVILMVKDYQQAEDLTHETFVRAYKFHHTFKRDSSPKTWLFSVAHNVTVDYMRKHKPIRLFKEVFTLKKEIVPSPEHFLRIKENSNELYSALGRLKETYREVIILRKIKGFSIAETSVILNWSESKVKSTLNRAMPALEEELLKEGYIHEQTK
ncbi:RNA polymerase sigma factor [Fredinandcohnia sp. 179-A 10B2 NHS]|uniref:RNA polymerase sigma factor n=1 Tax=Fredinandcohnia sp. 179-A 10B2 NHS TaxID=3235176 RepID=UPI0039A03A12